MGNITKTGLPCTAKDSCGSSNAMALYDDGGKFCHKCHGWDNTGKTNGNTGGKQLTDNSEFKDNTKGAPVDLDFYYQGSYKGIPERRIQVETCKKYGVRTDDNGNHMFPGYNSAGELIAVKTRLKTPEGEPKKFSIKGPWTSCVLFGAKEFPKTGRSLTVTEGEYDALAAYQMTGSKYPNVSILNGCSSAKKDFTSNFEAINLFESIVINFDSDTPGKEATEKVAPMFPGKTKVMHLVEAKDACDYLKMNKASKYTDEFWKAKRYTLGGIVNAADQWLSYKEKKNLPAVFFPKEWEEVNRKTQGMREGEIITLLAGTSIGKSFYMREIQHSILTNTDNKIFTANFEESIPATVGGLLSIEMNKRLMTTEEVIDEDEEKAAFDKLYGDGRFICLDHAGSIEGTSLLEKIEYAVVVDGCKFVFLDPITLALSETVQGQDSNSTMDAFMSTMLKMVKRLEFTLFLVAHVRKSSQGKSFEEGAIPTEDSWKGSASGKQVSFTTLALSRDKYAADETERNTGQLHVLKCRHTGDTGPADYLHFNTETGRLDIIDPSAFLDSGGNNEFSNEVLG